MGPDPVKMGPDPVKMGPDPVKMGPDPVKMGPDPVKMGRDPQHWCNISETLLPAVQPLKKNRKIKSNRKSY